MDPGGCLYQDAEYDLLFDLPDDEREKIMNEAIDEVLKEKLASLETVKSGRVRRAPQRLDDE